VSDAKGRKQTRPNPAAEARFDQARAVFMISVAAELAEMHPQTLRMYEARGLIAPKRSPKNTRLYSFEDVERLRRIQRMTADEGLNLAGVETVLELERELERARRELAKLRERAAKLQRQMHEEIDRVKRSLRADLVPYGAYDAREVLPSASASSSPGATGSAKGRARPIRIAVKRSRGTSTDGNAA
jgi:MerR family transcriptional regulator, heat shock protein HspR